MERGKGITTRADLSASSQNLRPETRCPPLVVRPSVMPSAFSLHSFPFSLFLAGDNRVTEQRLYITLLYRNPYEARKSIESRGRRNPGRRGGNRREIIARSSLLFHFSSPPPSPILISFRTISASRNRSTVRPPLQFITSALFQRVLQPLEKTKTIEDRSLETILLQRDSSIRVPFRENGSRRQVSFLWLDSKW